MDAPESELRPTSKLRRSLSFVGMALIAASIFLFALATVQSNSIAYEPAWLRAIPPTENRNEQFDPTNMSFSRAKFSDGVATHHASRLASMSYDDFVERMRKDLNASTGWKEYIPANSKTATWSRADPSGNYTIWGMDVGGKVQVMSSCVRNLTWFEKASRWCRRMVGSK